MSDAPALSEKKKVREVGVELLRVIAMFLIVCQHIMNHGGFLKNAGENTLLLNFINVLFVSRKHSTHSATHKRINKVKNNTRQEK